MTQQPESTAETCLLSATGAQTLLQAEYQQTNKLNLRMQISFINNQFMKKAVLYIAGLTIFTASYYHTRKQLDYMAAQSAPTSPATTEQVVSPPVEEGTSKEKPSAAYRFTTWR